MGITLPRFRYHDHAHCQGFAAPISDNGYEWVSRSQVYRANEDDSTTYVVELTDGLKAYTKLWGGEEPLSLWDEYNEEPFTKDTFIDALKDFHIGEWRRRYSTDRFGYIVCDGTQWELEFEYNNVHKPVRFNGDNSYPYNFDKFQMLFGIDAIEEDENE